MKSFVAKLLKSAGLLRFDLLVRSSATFPGPEGVPKGQLCLVRDGDVEKWACLTCPGGCGRAINLSLNPTRRPRWSVVGDFWQRPTVQPSVHQINDCGCHFWIKEGRIDWCEGGRPGTDSSGQVKRV
ncbi:DUF6527 family protein [Brucella grignonensis]|nr:DUF6527 family protein [Brucella grignonensis]